MSKAQALLDIIEAKHIVKVGKEDIQVNAKDRKEAIKKAKAGKGKVVGAYMKEDIEGDPTKFLNMMSTAITHIEQARTDMQLAFDDIKDHDPMGDEVRELEPMISSLSEMHTKMYQIMDAIKAHGADQQ